MEIGRVGEAKCRRVSWSMMRTMGLPTGGQFEACEMRWPELGRSVVEVLRHAMVEPRVISYLRLLRGGGFRGTRHDDDQPLTPRSQADK